MKHHLVTRRAYLVLGAALLLVAAGVIFASPFGASAKSDLIGNLPQEGAFYHVTIFDAPDGADGASPWLLADAPHKLPAAVNFRLLPPVKDGDDPDARGRYLRVKWFDLDITPTSDANRRNKKVVLNVSWRGSSTATGYELQESIKKAGNWRPIDAGWGGWRIVRSQRLQSNGNGSYSKTHSFNRLGKGVWWRVRVVDNDNVFSSWAHIYVTYGYRWNGSPSHHFINTSMFTDPNYFG